jgi:putative phosphoesterase
MKVAILADTHGFLDPRIAERVADCDIAVHAGDIGGADVLLSLAPREELVAIRGNNDVPEKWSAGEHSVLETLPREATLSLPGGDLVVVHGDDGGGIEQRHRRYRERYADARAVVYGHSHRLLVDREESPWILNPGAAGRTRTHGGPSCIILECDPEGWRLEEYRVEPRKYPNLRRDGKRQQPAQDDTDPQE